MSIPPDSESGPHTIERFRSARRTGPLVVLEGLHALKHALRFGARVREIVTADPRVPLDLARSLAPDLLPALEAARRVDASTFERMAPLAHPTGVIALADRPSLADDAAFAAPGTAPALLLENPVHLGNLGACVRVAAAAGARGVATTGPHDPWAPEALRAAAGLQFALPVVRARVDDPIPSPLLALTPDGDDLTAHRIPERAVLAFGTERTGLSDELLGRADARVRLPMREGVSSLNLATSVAAALYLWRARH